jgi:hypothetical protein
MDGNLRFVSCLRYGNEEYSENAMYCCICGFQVYNECEGYYDNDLGEHVSHRNVGNARYCEFCGQPTMLFKEKLLKPYTEVQEEQEDEEPFSFDESLPFN